MASVNDVMAFFCTAYPHKQELSNARLTKMVYLADWKSALSYERQITDIQWTFNHYGPFVNDIHNAALFDDRFDVLDSVNYYGQPKQIITIKHGSSVGIIPQPEIDILRFVIDQTASLNWESFIRLVYSTYPIIAGEKYSYLNLVEFARIYKNQQ